MLSVHHIKNFYEKSHVKLLKDYFHSNPRKEAALIFAVSNLDDSVKRILDIGCGIGWSSFEMANHSDAKILAIDLSDISIEIAKKLFAHKNITYKSIDITSENNLIEEKYNLIVLIDVFEHIPKEKRPFFYTRIDSMLAEKGKIVLTCPTVYHQNYLRKNKDESLQPVDEDVDLPIVVEFADKLKAKVSHFQFRSIWNRNDYLHAIIERPQSFLPYTDLDKQKYTLQRLDEKISNIEKANIQSLLGNDFYIKISIYKKMKQKMMRWRKK